MLMNRLLMPVLRFAGTFLLCLLLAGCAMSRLGDDLRQGEAARVTYSGTVVAADDDTGPLILIAAPDPGFRDVQGIRLIDKGGQFSIESAVSPLYFLAFADTNKDFIRQSDEPYSLAGPFGPASGAVTDIKLVVDDSAQPEPFPSSLLNSSVIPLFPLEGSTQFVLGDVVDLDAAVFSREQADKGLWEPYGFLTDAAAGVYFLEEYDPGKEVVLFVHGISGTPAQFEALIAGLDKERYQVWLFYYPSGLRLNTIASGLYDFILSLGAIHDVQAMHVVAHSMGGLVGRGAINQCKDNGACRFIRSFQSISTPWAGVPSAQTGVDWSPEVVPVWRDIAPDSDYLQALFAVPWNDDPPFYLFFGFKQDSLFKFGSGDGVISMSSQLRREAQMQSRAMRGFDRGHVDILKDGGLAQAISDNMAAAE